MKALYSFLLLTFFYISLQAQRSWELRIGGGYSFSTASQYLLTGFNSNASYSSTRVINSSLGRSIQANADLTWWVHRYLGITVGTGWQETAPSVKGTSTSQGFEYGYSASEKWRSQIVTAMAGVVLKIPDTKLVPYVRMGLLLPVYARVKNETEYSSQGMGYSSSGTTATTYRLRQTAGYNAAMGVSPKLGRQLRFFAEINLQSMAILAKHSEIIKYVSNGVDQLPGMSTNAKETDYVKKRENYVYDANKPGEELTFSFPYSSIGVRAGISFKL